MRHETRLIDQLRRDELPAYTEARGDCDHLDVARLLAFCGDEEACEVTPGEECVWCGWVDEDGEDIDGCCTNCINADPPWRSDFSRWPALLLELAAKLPPKRVEVACPSACDDKVAHDTPAQRWLLVVAAEAVARECWRNAETCLGCAAGFLGRHDECGAQQDALDACREWIAEPTPERERVWILVVVDSDGYPAWLPSPQNWQGLRPNLAAPLLAAADVIGPGRVREIASRAIREAVRG